jgi:hypothetical protein
MLRAVVKCRDLATFLTVLPFPCCPRRFGIPVLVLASLLAVTGLAVTVLEVTRLAVPWPVVLVSWLATDLLPPWPLQALPLLPLS